MLRVNRTGLTQIFYLPNGESIVVEPDEFIDDSIPVPFGKGENEFPYYDARMFGDITKTPKVWAVYNTFADTAFLKESISSVYSFVDFVVVQYGGNWWDKKYEVDDTKSVVLSIPDPENKIRLHYCGVFSGQRKQGQLDQRTRGLSYLDVGDWHWLIDSDEIYTYEDAERIASFLRSEESNKHEVLSLRMIVYYQTLNVVGWTEIFNRIFRKRKSRVFSGVAEVASYGRIVPHYYYKGGSIHHLSYIRDDEFIFRKFDDYEKRYKAGVFREVDSEANKRLWLDVRRSGNYSRYLHPIPGYNKSRGRIRDFRLPEVLQDSEYYLRPKYSVSIVVVSYWSAARIKEMLASFFRYRNPVKDVEWIFVDNGSGDVKELEKIVANLNSCRLIRNKENRLFTKAANQGIKASRNRNILLLNPDIIFQDGSWLKKMIDDLWRYPNGGICGCRQIDGEGKISFGGGAVRNGKFVHIGREEPGYGEEDFGQYSDFKETEWVTGSCFMIKRECYNALGALDEKYEHLDSDNKYCLKAKEHGFRVVYSPATIVHLTGKSVNKR